MLQSLTIFFGVIVAVLYLLHRWIRGGRKGELVDKIPGSYAWPIIGNIVDYIVSPEQIWLLLHSMNNKYYPIHRIWNVIIPMVHLYHPDDIEVVLSSTKHIEKSLVYNFLHPWLGTGLLTSTGEKWHQRRKILTPAFHFSVLQQFVGIFIEQSEKLVDSLCPDEEEIIDDLVTLLHKYTLNTICETAMGSTSSVDEEVLNEYRSSIHKIGDLTLNRVIKPWLHLDWMFRFSKFFFEQCHAVKVLHGFSTNIINQRKRYLKGLDSAQGVDGFDDDHVNGILVRVLHESKRRLAMLDLLISASQQKAKIDDDGIREEVDTFVFEGHDTTAMGLCFFLLLLAENKEIQDKARSEVDEVFAEKKGDKFTISDLQRMCYLERCTKESLRLYPSVSMISRQISEDLQLKNYLVPSGSTVNLFFWDLHRDPNFWPNPTVFDPDRFLPEQTRGRHPFAYVPFSAGPRNCIGQKFAMLEMKALIGNILHKFYLEPIDLASDVRLIPDLVLRPVNKIRIKLIRRSTSNASV